MLRRPWPAGRVRVSLRNRFRVRLRLMVRTKVRVKLGCHDPGSDVSEGEDQGES